MTKASPWDGINVPVSDFNVRTVAGDTSVPCYWGKDALGACLFIVELDGEFTVQFRKNHVMLKGVDVDLRSGSVPGQQRLVLTLDNQVDRDLFEGLCQTLVTSLGHASDSASSLAVALEHIRRWKNFFSGNTQHLSAEQVRGFFAEISFLGELIHETGAPSKAVDAWLGPDRGQHDFVFDSTAVEIKSLSGAERNSVRISSEDQLESLNDRLFLRVYRLNTTTNSTGSNSLNSIVESVRGLIDEAKASDSFDRKLATYGYAPLPHYDEPAFVIKEVRTYRVEEGFPRLVHSQMPSGVTRVSYDIGLEEISSFQCDDSTVFGED